jgi:hypothetical protein
LDEFSGSTQNRILRIIPQNEVVMLIDVSHTVENGMITYRGLPAPLICDFLSREQSRSLYADGTEFQIGKIEMVANTGPGLSLLCDSGES